MTGKESIEKGVEHFKENKRKEMAKKMKTKLSGQELEDHLTEKMLKRSKVRSEGIKNTRKILG